MAQLEASYALLAKKHMDQTVRLEAYEEELESLQSKVTFAGWHLGRCDVLPEHGFNSR